MQLETHVTWSLLEMAMPVPYMSAMMSEPGRPVAVCEIKCILSRPRSCRLRDTVISAAAASSPLAAANEHANHMLTFKLHSALGSIYLSVHRMKICNGVEKGEEKEDKKERVGRKGGPKTVVQDKMNCGQMKRKERREGKTKKEAKVRKEQGKVKVRGYHINTTAYYLSVVDTNTYRFMALWTLSGITWVSWYQYLDFTEARESL